MAGTFFLKWKWQAHSFCDVCVGRARMTNALCLVVSCGDYAIPAAQFGSTVCRQPRLISAWERLAAHDLSYVSIFSLLPRPPPGPPMTFLVAAHPCPTTNPSQATRRFIRPLPPLADSGQFLMSLAARLEDLCLASGSKNEIVGEMLLIVKYLW